MPDKRKMSDDETKKSDDAAASYSQTTKLIHGRKESKAWEFGHHLVPPVGASTTFRLDSTVRGAAGFAQFAQHERPDEHILIYDRLTEPNKGMLEEALADAEGAETAVAFASGMAAIAAAIRSAARLVKRRPCTHTP